uniref:Uncharacterized protein n=1 Tax=Rhabditophanes sp. KR3021 TaxID=114890 RepID=A0AC35TI95_9BILA
MENENKDGSQLPIPMKVYSLESEYKKAEEENNDNTSNALSESTEPEPAVPSDDDRDYNDSVDGVHESFGLKEFEFKVKSELAAKQISFGLKKDAFLQFMDAFKVL